MTIYGVGYRTLEYEPTSWFERVGAIATMEFKRPFRNRWGVSLFILSFWYVPVKVVWMYIFLGLTMDEEGRAVRGSVEMLQRMGPQARAFFDPFAPAFYFDQQLGNYGFLVFLVLTSIVSIRAISGDRATNALEIYWTRSISTLGYFLGKWLGSFWLLASILLGGSLSCWVLAQLIAPDWEYLDHTIAYVPGILGVLLLQSLVLSFVAVGFSAVAKSANLAWLLWIGVLVGGAVIAKLLTALARSFGWAAWDEVVSFDAIQLWDAVARICYYLVGEVRPHRSPDDYAVGAAWLSLGLYLVAVALILWRQLRTEKGVA
jgi:ABC-type transport system involved in multi-copper enzyme maturation permease subunit